MVKLKAGGTETAKSTNNGNLTRWERQCYDCMYTANRVLDVGQSTTKENVLVCHTS